MLFLLYSLSKCCCLHFWRDEFWSTLRDILTLKARVKVQAQITKCYFLWAGAINIQSLSGYYLMRREVSMVFLLLLVLYLSAVVYTSEEISLVSCWRRDILRVKGQALITNCNYDFVWPIFNHRVVTTRCAI